jgi:hypothetical protein
MSTATTSACRACGRDTGMPCMNTRDMEDSPLPGCRGALMLRGGGEYTVNRLASGKWHATLLLAAFRAGLASPSDPDAADALREMASYRLVASVDGGWTSLVPADELPAIAEGLAAAGLAETVDGALHATPTGRDGVLGRTPAPAA